MAKASPKWLDSAVFYQIYPQSFCDTNGDGIGDIPGIIEKLDYIKYLGANTIWLSPWFDSPFRDAGYDISDYCKVAPRYGTNEDAKRLFDEAAKKGIRVVLDLVIGHTSIDHPWFQESCKEEKNKYSNWYIWNDCAYTRTDGQDYFIAGYGERYGGFMPNFFYSQPALNYGFAKPDPKRPWQLATNHPDVLAMREEIKNVMRFWLEMGCAGFRVDMAPSLVKHDTDSKATSAFWKEIRAMLGEEYPEAVLISEWSDPSKAIPAGFHTDFLIFTEGYYTLFRCERPYRWLPECEGKNSYFNKAGKGDIMPFLEELARHTAITRNKGYIALVSGNHDFIRMSNGKDADDLAVAFAFLLTMPGLPFIYNGDEIGMRFLDGVPSKEGGYERTGSRTPMQWTKDANAGFSTGDPASLYLPVDTSADAPAVSDQLGKEGSLLETLKALIALRGEHPALQPNAKFSVVYAESKKYPFVFERQAKGERLLIAVNPADRPVSRKLDIADAKSVEECLIGKGATLKKTDAGFRLQMAGASYGVFRLK